MNSGIISLKCLYNFAFHHPDGNALNGRAGAGRQYGREVSILTEPIPEKQGFYSWGKYESQGSWKNIYLGKAHFGTTTNLRARIREELKDERCFVWACLLPKGQIFDLGAEYYAEQWPNYVSGWYRALRKKGTSHIAWVAAPKLNKIQLNTVESDLIETLNPSANIDRPTPLSDQQSVTLEVINELRHEIHNERLHRFDTDC